MYIHRMSAPHGCEAFQSVLPNSVRLLCLVCCCACSAVRFALPVSPSPLPAPPDALPARASFSLMCQGQLLPDDKGRTQSARGPSKAEEPLARLLRLLVIEAGTMPSTSGSPTDAWRWSCRMVCWCMVLALRQLKDMVPSERHTCCRRSQRPQARHLRLSSVVADAVMALERGRR